MRRNNELREELAAAERARAQAENDYADALEELENLQVVKEEQRGVNQTTQCPKPVEEKTETSDAQHLTELSAELELITGISWSLEQTLATSTLRLSQQELMSAETDELNAASIKLLSLFFETLQHIHPMVEVGISIQEQEIIQSQF